MKRSTYMNIMCEQGLYKNTTTDEYVKAERDFAWRIDFAKRWEDATNQLSHEKRRRIELAHAIITSSGRTYS